MCVSPAVAAYLASIAAAISIAIPVFTGSSFAAATAVTVTSSATATSTTTETASSASLAASALRLGAQPARSLAKLLERLQQRQHRRRPRALDARLRSGVVSALQHSEPVDANRSRRVAVCRRHRHAEAQRQLRPIRDQLHCQRMCGRPGHVVHIAVGVCRRRRRLWRAIPGRCEH